MVLRPRRADVLGRRRGDRRDGRSVRLRAARRAPHVHGHLRRGALPAPSPVVEPRGSRSSSCVLRARHLPDAPPATLSRRPWRLSPLRPRRTGSRSSALPASPPEAPHPAGGAAVACAADGGAALVYAPRMSHPDPNAPPDLTPDPGSARSGRTPSRERATILELPSSNPEGRAVAELTALVGARVVGEHRHPAMVERFTVLEGELTVKRDGQTSVLREGETAVVEPRRVARLVERRRPGRPRACASRSRRASASPT